MSMIDDYQLKPLADLYDELSSLGFPLLLLKYFYKIVKRSFAARHKDKKRKEKLIWRWEKKKIPEGLKNILSKHVPPFYQ